MVQRGPASSRPALGVEEIAGLGYDDLAAHRTEWLDLRPPEALDALVGEIPS